MSVPIGDVSQAAVVLAGGVLGLTHGLFEVRISGLILGVNGDIVAPCRTVDGSHGQRYEERIASKSHIFRDASLHNEIQPPLHVGCSGVAGGVGLRHSNTAVLHGSFQSVLHIRSVGCESCGQLVVQHIAGEVVDTIVGLVSICAGQADGGQHVGAAVGAVEAIQHAHLPLTVHDLIVHGNVGYAEVGELHALNGVLCQLVDNRVVTQAGGNVGLGIPRTVVAGLGDVVFIDAQGCFFAGIDDRRRICCGKCRGDEAQSHDSGHEHGQYAMDLFHVQPFSFVM